jgi:hypothetical protein|nr:MAG TPA: hypothetical protein [Caudoviricetes sp.]
MPRWFWTLLWVSQVINWVVTIWAYGTLDGSCLMAPAFTIAWMIKDDIVECYTTLFTDDWEYEDDDIMEEWNEEDYYRYYDLRKGA